MKRVTKRILAGTIACITLISSVNLQCATVEGDAKTKIREFSNRFV